jgi:ADP-heptose:LPS heptosyltransferase
MPKILLVKTSSIGDVIHNFPMVSDIRRHFLDSQGLIKITHIVRLAKGKRRCGLGRGSTTLERMLSK